MLTVCWNILNFDNTLEVIIFQIGQSAGNPINSEYLRDYTLAIAVNFNLIIVNNRTRVNNQLGTYLAGLIEGDGHIALPTPAKPGYRGATPRIELTFHDSNFPLAFKLMKVLNSGYIRYLKNQNAYRLIINDAQRLVKIVTLINGYFRSPKIESLYRLIDWLNHNTNNSFEKLPIDTSILLNNAWLAGFSDADSNFYIRISDKKFYHNTGKWSKARIACRYSLEQRKIEPKFLGQTEPFIRQIAKAFGVTLSTSFHNTPPKEYWYIIVTAGAPSPGSAGAGCSF